MYFWKKKYFKNKLLPTLSWSVFIFWFKMCISNFRLFTNMLLSNINFFKINNNIFQKQKIPKKITIIIILIAILTVWLEKASTSLSNA